MTDESLIRSCPALSLQSLALNLGKAGMAKANAIKQSRCRWPYRVCMLRSPYLSRITLTIKKRKAKLAKVSSPFKASLAALAVKCAEYLLRLLTRHLLFVVASQQVVSVSGTNSIYVRVLTCTHGHGSQPTLLLNSLQKLCYTHLSRSDLYPQRWPA